MNLNMGSKNRKLQKKKELRRKREINHGQDGNGHKLGIVNIDGFRRKRESVKDGGKR